MKNHQPNKDLIDVFHLEPGEPVHILSIAVRGTEDMDDNQMAQCFGSFCKLNRDELFKHRIRRITFAALKK